MEEHLTLGQRIQKGRKATGLSQEALGEQLGVSRQAVSKWEADAALPELDKLIAMSRILSLSVGQLLGTEEDPSPAAPELTERELAAIEAIVAKYSAAQQPRWPRKKRRLAAAAVGIALALGLFWLHDQLQTLDRRFTQLQSQVNGIETGVATQIHHLTGQISDILSEGASILADSRVEITAADPLRQTVTLSLSASPKEWSADTAARFTAQLSDGQQRTADAQGSGGTFTARNFTVPMDSEITLSVVLTEGEAARSQVLDTLTDCVPETFQLEGHGSWSSSWVSGSNRVDLEYLSVHISPAKEFPGMARIVPETVDACLFRSGSRTPEQVIPIKEAPELFKGSAGEVEMSQFSCPTAYTLEPGDEVVAALRIRDNYGQVVYFPMDAHYADENGHIRHFSFMRRETWQPGQLIPRE